MSSDIEPARLTAEDRVSLVEALRRVRGKGLSTDLIQLEGGKARLDAWKEVVDTVGCARFFANVTPGIMRPKRHQGAMPLFTKTYEYRRVIDLPTAAKSALPPTQYIQVALNPDTTYNIGLNDGAAAGQTVPHVHRGQPGPLPPPIDDVGGYVDTAKERVQAEVKLPPGYYLKWTGQYELLERVRARMSWIIPLTLAIVFVIRFYRYLQLLPGG
mgnify:CR=1 FL=1